MLLNKDIKQLRKSLINDSKLILDKAKVHTEKERQTLALLDPANIVNRGYSIIFSEKDAVITDVTNLDVNEIIKISMRDGRATANIKEVFKKNE